MPKKPSKKTKKTTKKTTWSDLFEEGSKLSKKGQYKEAMKKLEASLEAAPKLDDPSIKDQKLRKDLQKTEKDLGQVQKIITYGNIAHCHAMLENYPKAISWYEKLIKMTPQNGRLYYNIGLAYSRQGKHLKAISYFKTSLTKNSKKFKMPEHEAQQELGKSFLFSNQTWKAIRALKRVIQLKKADYSTYILLGDAYHRLQMYKEAMQAMKKALKKQPKDAYTLDYMGHLHNKLGEYGKAIEYAKKAIKVEPDAHKYHNLACYYSMKKNKKQAFATLKKAIKKGWSNYKTTLADSDFDNIRNTEEFSMLIHKMAGKKVKIPTVAGKAPKPVEEKQKEEEKKVVKKNGKKKVSIFKDPEERFIETARKLEKKGDYKGAVEFYKRSLQAMEGEAKIEDLKEMALKEAFSVIEHKRKKLNAMLVYQAIAYCQVRLGNKPGAANAMRRVIGIAPYEEKTYYILSSALFEQERYEEAAYYAKEGKKYYRGKQYTFEFISILAQIELRRGEFWKAIRAFKELEKLEPKEWDHHYYMASGYAALGMIDLMMAELEKAKALGWSEINLLKNDPNFKKMKSRKVVKEFIKSFEDKKKAGTKRKQTSSKSTKKKTTKKRKK